jgi:hypothetical protein
MSVTLKPIDLYRPIAASLLLCTSKKHGQLPGLECRSWKSCIHKIRKQKKCFMLRLVILFEMRRHAEV